MGSASEESVVEGVWGNFVFRMIQPEDHPAVLKHLRDCLYERAMGRVGYTKDLDDEMESLFIPMLNDGHNMNFIAVDKNTGNIAGCRIITKEAKTKQEPETKPNITSRFNKSFLKFYGELLEKCRIYESYDIDEFPHMFGISVDPLYCRQGLAKEIYRRSITLMKSRGFKVAVVSFVSPFSRAAATRNGYKELTRVKLLDIEGIDGKVLYSEANPEDFFDIGVFEL